MHATLSPLRSWLKEERRLLPRSSRLWRLGFSSLLLLAVLLGLETRRRSEWIQAELEGRRLEQLELVSSALSDIRRTSFDWARWDDSLRFVQGRNPQFVQRDMAQTSLFSAGGVMVLFDLTGARLVSFGSAGANHPSQRPLESCAQANLKALVDLSSAVQLLCRGDGGRSFLGVLTQISNNASSAPAAGALVMFEPLIRETHGARLRAQLRSLEGQLISDGTPGLQSLPATISLIGGTGQPIGLSRQSSLGPTLMSLRDDLLLGAALLSPLLLIRMQLTLAHRRQRLEGLRRERLATLQIQRVCKQLDGLLGQMGLEGETQTASQRVMARLISPSIHGEFSPSPRALETRLNAIARRFQHFLDAARSLALLDTLTQIPNRRFFVEQLDLEVERHRQGGPAIALLFVDVDRFKEINDSFGHATGDLALILVADRLRQLIGLNDFLARYGGDEFVILHQLEASTGQDHSARRSASLDFAERIASAFDGPVDLGGIRLELSLSLGITLLRTDLAIPQDAIQQCDLAMLQAKRNKHSRIAIFELDHGVPQKSDYELYIDLLQAIREHQFRMLFQPIIDEAGQLRAVEALARWPHPRLGLIPPDQFLRLAERHRQILRLGDELLRQTLVGYSQIRNNENQNLALSFNISPSQLEDPSLVSRILNLLEQHSINPEILTLELTEQGILDGSSIVNANLQRLRQKGIRLSLDDFGTGFSSLSLLSKLQPDEVKIDRSFVASMDHDPYALQIITLLGRMAPALGFQLVAEGVETQATLSRLQQLGIARFQGYLFAAPLESNAVEVGATWPTNAICS